MKKYKIDQETSNLDLRVNFNKAKEDPDFLKLIKDLDLSEEILMKYTSSLLESVNEKRNCKKCKGLSECKNEIQGSYIAPVKNKNGIDFVYIDCEYKQKEQYKKNVSFFDLPVRLKDASLSNIYTDDESRVVIIKKMMSFLKNYTNKEKTKGLYLYGSFGSGKSYLIAALFNELAKKGVKCVMVHVPELVRSIKDSFSTDYSERFDLLKNVDLLLLDDIGAEYLTPWSRDEVLEPILQYRMDQELPTFFTSNYDPKQLENHFMLSDDKMKAKRLIERVLEVSEPIKLASKNMRKI